MHYDYATEKEKKSYATNFYLYKSYHPRRLFW